MDNKEAIKMIRCLVANYGSYLDDKTAGYNNHDLCRALMKAIASLDTCDKVKEDIKHSQFIFLSGDKEVECIPIFEVMNIINKQLKEKEECL